MIRALLRSLQPREAGLLRRALMAMALSALAQGAALALLPMAFAQWFGNTTPWAWAIGFTGMALL
ncbi:MAG: ABC transporter ATP-binding protein, partial [Pseudomonas sp.]